MHHFIKYFILSFLYLSVALQAREININNIVDKATQSHKNIFIFLHQTDCGYCESMIQFTLDDDKVTPLLNKYFVYTHINIKEDDHVIYNNFEGSGRAFARFVGYDFYPTSIFLNKDYKIIYAIPGYQEEDKFFHILNFIIQKAYKNMDFDEYLIKNNITLKSE